MALKTLSVPLVEKKSSSKKTPKVVTVEGRVVRDFNRATAAAKLVNEALAKRKAKLLGTAFEQYVEVRLAEPLEDPSSIYLEDSTGARVNYQFKSAYSTVDPDAVEALFDDTLNDDVNKHVLETVTAKFDSKVFVANGKFNKKVYDIFLKAIEAASIEAAVPNPLSTAKVAVLKENFHAERFINFPTVEAQRAISAVCPNSQVLVAPAAGKE